MGFSNRFKSPEFPLDKYITPSHSRSPSQPFLQQTNLQDYLCHQQFPTSSAYLKPLLTPIENLPRRDISPLSFKRMSSGSPLDSIPDFYQRQNSHPNLPPQNNPTAVMHKGRILFRKDSNSEFSNYRRVVTERAESPEIIKPVSPDKLPYMPRNYRNCNNNNMPIIRDKSLPKMYSSRSHVTSAEELSRSRSTPPIRFPSLDENKTTKRLVSFGETREIEYEKYQLPMTLNQVLSKIEAEIKEEVNIEEGGKYVGSLKKKAKYVSEKEMECMAMTFGKNFEEDNGGGETNLNYLKGLNSSRQQNFPNQNPAGGILRARKFRTEAFLGKNEELRQEVTLLKMQYEKETKNRNQKFTKAKRMQSIRSQI